MALVGLGAADANRRNFLALSRLSGDFLDRLRGLETIRFFHRGREEVKQIDDATEDFARAPWKCCAWHSSPPLCWNFSRRSRLLSSRFILVFLSR